MGYLSSITSQNIFYCVIPQRYCVILFAPFPKNGGFGVGSLCVVDGLYVVAGGAGALKLVFPADSGVGLRTYPLNFVESLVEYLGSTPQYLNA